MEMITQEIERALSAGLYYVALVATLSLPDICAALESPNGETDKDKYKKWYGAWLESSYPLVTGDDLYDLRCGVIHQARVQRHRKGQYSRVLFTLPNPMRLTIRSATADDALALDVVKFCGDMIDAVLRWYTAKQNDPNVQTNFPSLVEYRPNGLAPYIVGLPLIG